MKLQISAMAFGLVVSFSTFAQGHGPGNTAFKVASSSSDVVISECSVKSSAGWPIFIRGGEVESYKLKITQENPDNFFDNDQKQGLDLAMPMKLSIANTNFVQGIMPASGVESGERVITPGTLVNSRKVKIGLISEDVSGVLEIEGQVRSAKKFDASLTTISKEGKTALANLECKNIKN